MEVHTTLLERLDAQDGDLIFFDADSAKVVNEALGTLRCKFDNDMNLYTCKWAPLWMVDLPIF